MKQLRRPVEIERIRRDARLNRAVEAYKFFHPTVSMQLDSEGLEEQHAPANHTLLIQLTTPDPVALTQNSDTPYGLADGAGERWFSQATLETPKTFMDEQGAGSDFRRVDVRPAPETRG